MSRGFSVGKKQTGAGGNSYITVTGMLVENTPKRYQNLVLWACPKFILTPKRFQINNNILELQILIVIKITFRHFVLKDFLKALS